jgi:hypothetical protein
MPPAQVAKVTTAARLAVAGRGYNAVMADPEKKKAPLAATLLFVVLVGLLFMFVLGIILI